MKRIAALLLCLLLLPGALAETYLVQYTPGYAADYMPRPLLLRDDGTRVAGDEDYLEIIEITDPLAPEAERRYSAMSRDAVVVDRYGETECLHAMIDADGKPLTGFEYSYIYLDSDTGLISFGKPDGRIGFLDPDGATLVEGAYRYLSPMADGGWLAVEDGAGGFLTELLHIGADDAPAALLRISADGIVTDSGLKCRYFSMPTTAGDPIVLSDDEGCFCVNGDLEPCIDGHFNSIGPFRNGLAVAQVREGDPWGIVDAAGAYVLPAEYGSVALFAHEGRELALAVDPDGRAYTVFDRNMQRVSRVDLHAYPDVADTGIYPDEDGAISVWLYDAQYNSTQLKFSAAGLPVEQPDWGGDFNAYFRVADEDPPRVVLEASDGAQRCSIVDREGNRCSGDFQSLDPGVWLRGHGRFVTTTYRSTPTEYGYDDIIWNTRRLGVVDENGQEILPTIYSDLTVLDLDRFWVRLGSRSGMIDSAGHWYYAVDDYAYLMD